MLLNNAWICLNTPETGVQAVALIDTSAHLKLWQALKMVQEGAFNKK